MICLANHAGASVASLTSSGHPQVLEIETDNWTGEMGQTIRVKVQDDTFVAGVHVAIHDGNGDIVEQGQALQTDGLWWEYTTTAQVSGGLGAVTATAKDLPGNNHQLIWQNN